MKQRKITNIFHISNVEILQIVTFLATFSCNLLHMMKKCKEQIAKSEFFF